MVPKSIRLIGIELSEWIISNVFCSISFVACKFCGRTTDDEEVYGKMFNFEKGKVHYYCMVGVLCPQCNKIKFSLLIGAHQ